MPTPRPSCRRLFVQEVRLALFFALARAGRSMPARIAMMAMTTSNSMSVKARRRAVRLALICICGERLIMSMRRAGTHGNLIIDAQPNAKGGEKIIGYLEGILLY